MKIADLRKRLREGFGPKKALPEAPKKPNPKDSVTCPGCGSTLIAVGSADMAIGGKITLSLKCNACKHVFTA